MASHTHTLFTSSHAHAVTSVHPHIITCALTHRYVPGFTFNCMGWTAEEQRVWVANNLGPTLKDAAYDSLVLMIMDDQRINLPDWAVTVRAEGGGVRRWCALFIE